MQIENIIKDLPPPPQPPMAVAPPTNPIPPPPPPPPLPNFDFMGDMATPQLLQLKWQLFCVQRSQQELAGAILQLSSMILANTSPPPPPPPQPTNPLPLPPLLLPNQPLLPPQGLGKRRWSSRERGSSGGQTKYGKIKNPSVVVPCQCDVCQRQDEEMGLPKSLEQSPLDLYVSYFLNNLENKQMQPLAGPHQLQEKPLDLATHSRRSSSKPDELLRPRPTCSQPAMGEGAVSDLVTSPSSLNLSPPPPTPQNTSPLLLFHKSQLSDSKFLRSEPAFDDILQLEAASNFKPSWGTASSVGEKDRAVVILNPVEPREMFVGGEPKVRLPVWAYKKCVYMVGREQKRPAARLCLCLLQSLFSLRYLVSHNYSGSRQKRPIDPLVMKAVLKQAMMQFGKGECVLPGSEFSQGKLRDYLNNAFRVMAFRRRRGDRVKSPFWNDAGEPILSLDPPKDFRLNDIILTKVIAPPPYR